MITLRRITKHDFPLLGTWLALPHVKTWWGDPRQELQLIIEGEEAGETQGYLADFDGSPFAYLQTWRVKDMQAQPDTVLQEPWLAHLSPDAVGIDMFVGPTAMLNKGRGSLALKHLVTHLFANGARHLIIDPDTKNTAAIRAYQKAGFQPYSVPDTRGAVLLMSMNKDPS